MNRGQAQAEQLILYPSQHQLISSLRPMPCLLENPVSGRIEQQQFYTCRPEAMVRSHRVRGIARRAKGTYSAVIDGIDPGAGRPGGPLPL